MSDERVAGFTLCDGPTSRYRINSDYLPRVGDEITWVSENGTDTARHKVLKVEFGIMPNTDSGEGHQAMTYVYIDSGKREESKVDKATNSVRI